RGHHPSTTFLPAPGRFAYRFLNCELAAGSPVHSLSPCLLVSRSPRRAFVRSPCHIVSPSLPHVASCVQLVSTSTSWPQTEPIIVRVMEPGTRLNSVVRSIEQLPSLPSLVT